MLKFQDPGAVHAASLCFSHLVKLKCPIWGSPMNLQDVWHHCGTEKGLNHHWCYYLHVLFCCYNNTNVCYDKVLFCQFLMMIFIKGSKKVKSRKFWQFWPFMYHIAQGCRTFIKLGSWVWWPESNERTVIGSHESNSDRNDQINCLHMFKFHVIGVWCYSILDFKKKKIIIIIIILNVTHLTRQIPAIRLWKAICVQK